MLRTLSDVEGLRGPAPRGYNGDAVHGLRRTRGARRRANAWSSPAGPHGPAGVYAAHAGVPSAPLQADVVRR